MSIITDHTAAFEAAFADLAETVTYNGDSVLGSISYGSEAGGVPGVRGNATLAEIDILKSDVPDPAYKDTVVIGTTTWIVQTVLSGDEWGWRLLISSNERPTRR